MTLHLRQPNYAINRIELLLEDALNAAAKPAPYRAAFKRALDVTLVLCAALPALLIILFFAFLVARDGSNPFYFQSRVGRGGREFRMWKLRSMVPNADRLLEAYLAGNPDAREEWGCMQKLRKDPRITPIGALIRKASIDELPQLLNVLNGDMSLVGPRPIMPSQRTIYPGTAYYSLRPGITGFWQTSVRNESSFADRAAFDTAYLHELSFVTDLRILVRTVGVVVNGTGY